MNGNIKNALLAVIMIAVIAASVLLFIKPNIEAKQAADGEITTLQTRLADLQAKEADRPIYEAGIARNKKEFSEMLAKFPEDIEQANYIKFLGDLDNDKDIDFDIASVDFNQPETIYVMGQGVVGANGETTDASTTTTTDATADTSSTTTSTDTTASEMADPDDTTGMNDTNMAGKKVNMTIDYSGTYKGIKNVLAYVNTNEDRMTIDTMDVTYSAEDEKLSGSFSFNMFAITSDQRKLAEPDIEGVDIGVDNIFNDTDKSNNDINKDIKDNIENGDKVLKDYDYYVALNPSTSNEDSICIGAKGDTSTNLSSNENFVQNATVKFFMVGVKYYVSYSIGDQTYPENFEQGVEFDPGEDLNLAIQSSKRKNDKDKSGVKLTIDNETDKTLNVKVDGDDNSNPRVRISSRIGKVQIYD